MVFAENGSLVVPGQPLCMIEEFLPGVNVKQLKDGVIVSMKIGIVRYDFSQRIVKVHSLKTIEEIRVGDEVLVEVKDVQEKIAVSEILAVNGRPIKYKRVAIILPNPKIKQEMNKFVGVGDLVLAEVVTVFAGVIGVSIWKPRLGAIYSICNSCGNFLKRTEKTLVCTVCGNKEKRKIVPIYGNLAKIGNMIGGGKWS
ncbi:MAG: exosome complex RNA-binding protein Csl4 [Nitrososphaerota archaeon]|nr:exosome complex RNA-binding protein Csl4 [Candidatus Geocrenenecus dongiae]